MTHLDVLYRELEIVIHGLSDLHGRLSLNRPLPASALRQEVTELLVHTTAAKAELLLLARAVPETNRLRPVEGQAAN